MKNHIVSQMIIKRFASAINVFDVESGKIDTAKKPNKVFYKNDRLSDDLEKLIAEKIEGPFGNLLHHKLLAPGFVTLTREELYLLKRYLMMVSVRMYDEHEFSKMMESFSENAKRYAESSPYKEYLCGLRTNDQLRLNEKELYELALRIYCENKNPAFIELDKRVTIEILAWARTFMDSYLAIWDAPDGMEFILSDCSMVSEYEGCHQLTGGLDLSKTSYSCYKMLHEKTPEEQLFHLDVLSKNYVMYENYNLFNLSSKRCLVLINPFFRQYFGCRTKIEGGKEYVMPKPDIWPAIIQDEKLFKMPVNEYKAPGLYVDEDLFFYEAKTLAPKDVVYINSLIISMTKEIFGFNDIAAIEGSVSYYIWEKASLKNGPFLSLEKKEDILRFCDDIVYSPAWKLYMFCNERIGRQGSKVSFIQLFDEIVEDMLRDFRSNKYIYWHLLNKEKLTRESENLSFLGNPDERIEYIKKKYKELWGEDFVSKTGR